MYYRALMWHGRDGPGLRTSCMLVLRLAGQAGALKAEDVTGSYVLALHLEPE